MKKFLYIILGVLGSWQLGYSQHHKMDIIPGKMIDEYTPEFTKIKRELPEGYTQEMQDWVRQKNIESKSTQNRTSASAAKFTLSFETPPPADVRAIFEKAAESWASILNSDVEVKVLCRWRSLATNVLGSAGATANVRNFPGAGKVNTYYPIALAEKMAHKNLNGTDFDIVANFNADYANWYKGLDGVPTINQIDLYSVVLHEFGHGLGFIGQVAVDNSTAYYIYPGIFDQFMVNSSGLSLTDTLNFKNDSPELKAQLTSGNLFLSTTKLLAANNKEKAKLYAPNTYTQGSSIYHVDASKYRPKDPNALMTPSIAKGEITRELGTIVPAAFNDFGWYSSSIVPTADLFTDTEDVTKDYVFTVNVYSDTIVKANSLKLMLSTDGNIQNATSRPLTLSGTSYSYTLPKDTKLRTIAYYWLAEEASGKKFTTPAQAPLIAGTTTSSYYKFTIGQDTVKPVAIYSNPLKYVFSNQTKINLPTLLANDNIGIDTVYMEYSIGSGAVIKSGFTRSTTDAFSYNGAFNFATGQIKAGDIIKYRVVVKDKAKIANYVYFPAIGNYEFVVLTSMDAVNTYKTDFENKPTSDFYLKGFAINQPANFTSLGLNSDHPYANGSEESYDNSGGSDKFTNNDAILLKPIIVRADTARITFDEVVLVETAETTGTSFLNADGTVNRSFYDYVIVQGSKDGGLTWNNLRDGWDSNDYSEWQKAWTGTNVDKNGNSTLKGTATLFQKREIDILGSGKFNPGDKVLLRFRLHSDIGAYGWGWAIDNLNIQGAQAVTPPKLVLAVENGTEATGLLIRPNPSQGLFRVQLPLEQMGQTVELHVVDLQGRVVYQDRVNVGGSMLDREIEAGNWPTGTYFCIVKTEKQQWVKRVFLLK